MKIFTCSGIRRGMGAKATQGLEACWAIPVYVLTIIGPIQQSNIWPVMVLFASPPAFLYVLVVAFITPRAGAPVAL